jgi:hypothetical protein
MARPLDLDAAETFIWLHARLVDRHRYACLFKDGDPEQALDALRPYQNADGGFGHALEPDDRGRSSQPAHVHAALRVLDEVGRCRGPMLKRALDYLASATTPDGGVPVALASLRRDPRAPWWDVEGDAPPGALLPTAGIVGVLIRNGVQHPWIEPATAFCWRAIAALESTHPYELDCCLTFLEHVPDRDRADLEIDRIGRLVREQRLVALDRDAPGDALIPPGYAPGELHFPLDYAPRPASPARRWFSDREIERDLDTLERAQAEDGGWTFNWRAWNPAAALEWRGWVTIRALTMLRAYGRLPR